MDRDGIFADLNREQRRAVETVRGPVCILAGAGSGKTTTITRRIANQVATGAFRPDEVLAVTFTDKAAGEMRERLASLGVAGVRASTFHSAALGQLHGYAKDPPGAVLPSKVILLSHIARTLPGRYRFRPVGDLATEIEWAKNRRLTPDAYRGSLGDHRPPIPPDLMARVFREYERRKAASGRMDFEDLLELAIRMFDDDEQARALFRDRFRAFTVDEFQDVNLLQQALLERWLGAGDELCVVGDDYQAIYSFVGATPRYLLEVPARFPHAAVVRLETNYRSTPQILELANRLTPNLGGSEKVLRPSRPDGPAPVVRAFDGADETRFIVETIRSLRDEGLPYSEMAVLYRTNARSVGYEQAFSAASIPVDVREGAFLSRQAARRMRAQLGSSSSTAVAEGVRRAAREAGYLDGVSERLGEQEAVRQADLARLIELAVELDDGARTLANFFADLDRRFGENAAGRGVHLLTYHRAKGLEFEAVFLPRLEERELPIRLARTPAELAEERRLFYVGITRAKRYLFLLRADRPAPSRFLRELGVVGNEPARPRPADTTARESPAYAALAEWRRRRARTDRVAAFLVFHNATLEEIARRTPTTVDELASVPGVGPLKLERYGAEVLAALAAA